MKRLTFHLCYIRRDPLRQEIMPLPRVRFAPSPTGYLHVGGARTALFNWLFARHTDGTMVLRIEDTDRERSTDAHTRVILDGLAWLGITWDEGPYFQGEYGAKHAAEADRLLAEGKAYRCFCTREELDAQRARAEAAGGSFRYDRRCYRLSASEIEQRLASGAPFAIRFLLPDDEIAWDDAVHGRIVFQGRDLDDFVILRSDRTAIYNLAVVSDDIAMRITHVIRGDDHISNTPKQIALYRALGHEPPVFAHVPMILGTDGKKLSKRHGATAVGDYQHMGILPEAMLNFLALLGWSPGGNDELFTMPELVERFTLEGISGGNAVFNTEKLDWFNHQHLLRLPDEELLTRLAPPLQAAGLWRQSLTGSEFDWMRRVLSLLKPRAKKLTEYVDGLRPFLQAPAGYDVEAVARHLSAPGLTDHVAALEAAYASAPFDEASLEQRLRQLADERGIKAGALIHATRIAMTGRMVSPGLFEMLVLLGRDTVIARLAALRAHLAA